MKLFVVPILTAIILIGNVSAQTPQAGRSILLTPSFIESIRQQDKDLGAKLRAVAAYNEAVKRFGYMDTIVVALSRGEYTFSYKNELLRDFTLSRVEPNHPFMLYYEGDDRLTRFTASMDQSPSRKFEIVAMPAPDSGPDLMYTIYHYENDVLTGRYERQTQTGKTLIFGQYCQRDTSFIDTISYFNPETYEKSVQIYERTSHAFKSGTWYYYSVEGALLKKEEYGDCE